MRIEAQILPKAFISSESTSASFVQALQQNAQKTATQKQKEKKAQKQNTSSRPLTLQKPLPSFKITQSFGWRTHPVTRKPYNFHEGVDLRATSGTPVKVSADGKIIFGKFDGIHGWRVKVQHKNGVVTSYSHLSAYSKSVIEGEKGNGKSKSHDVDLGRMVSKGQVIGYVGSSGKLPDGTSSVTGPHLHYEIRVNGKLVNPAKYFKIG